MRVIALALFGLVACRSTVAFAQDEPPPSPPRDDSEAIKRLEQHIAELQSDIAQEKKAREDQGKRLDALQAAATPAPAAPNTDYAPAKSAFGFADFSWMPGNYGASFKPLQYGAFSGEIRVDSVYHYEFSQPSDDTISGSSEVFRHNEVQVTQLGFGGDVYYKGVQARLMTQFGMYSQTTPRNDASPGRGGWNLDNAYRYVSEAYGGYHFDVHHGLNIQAGIFMSYVGLWSYYNFDNWTYQPSYVSSNTPWFFNGLRVQYFPNENLKLELWVVNGWQSYGKFNDAPGLGLQIAWRPSGSVGFIGNQYYGTDTLGIPGRRRVHTDDSVMVKYYDRPNGALSRMAASLTVDAGCEEGGGVSCGDQYFLGFMVYDRMWFAHNHLGLTLGGGAITNPGRYLVLLPPINGATAFTGSPYFTEAPGDRYAAWDMQVTADWMPEDFVTFRAEYNHRAANVPYFTGGGGVTPPGGNNGAPGTAIPGWSPDLVKAENRMTFAVMVKY